MYNSTPAISLDLTEASKKEGREGGSYIVHKRAGREAHLHKNTETDRKAHRDGVKPTNRKTDNAPV